MSSKHLAKGDAQPPVEEGKLRLYSMEYCPYAHRARLVLKVKNVPHDIVNVNLMKKPDWLFKVHPEGKVPALDIGDKIIVESLDIANYLNEKYPEPALYPSDENSREQDKALIGKIDGLTKVFYTIILQLAKKEPKEWLEDLRPHLQVFEDELKKRGTTYFGGDKPGMVDYMLWPWAERAGTVNIVLKDRLPLGDADFALMRAWRRNMRKDPVVDAIYTGPEKFHKVVLFKTEGLEPDYDSV